MTQQSLPSGDTDNLAKDSRRKPGPDAAFCRALSVTFRVFHPEPDSVGQEVGESVFSSICPGDSNVVSAWVRQQ